MSTPDAMPQAAPEAAPYTLAALIALIMPTNGQLHRDCYEICRQHLDVRVREEFARKRAHEQECPICRIRTHTTEVLVAMNSTLPAADNGDAEAYAKLIGLLKIYVPMLSYMAHAVAAHHEAAIVRQHDGSRKKCLTCATLASVWGLLAGMRRLIAAHQGKVYLAGQLVATIRPAEPEELTALGFEADRYEGAPALTCLADGTALIPMVDFAGNAHGVQWALTPDGDALGLYPGKDGEIDTDSVLVDMDDLPELANQPGAEDIGDPQDYVVAIDLENGKAFEAWPGEAYRNYNEARVHQYQVSMANGPEDAKQRAEAIHAQFNRGKSE